MSDRNSQPQQQQLPPAAPTPAEQPAAAQPTTYKNPMLHTAALICTPLAFIGLVLPPRRLDFRAVVLGGTGLWGVSQLKYDYTGSSMLHNWMNKDPSSSAASSSLWSTTDLPSERATAVKRMIKEEKARRERAREMLASGMSEADVKRVQELERRKQQAEAGAAAAAAAAAKSDNSERGTLQSLWMGDAEDDWREKRAKKEQEALSEGGEGIWGLITEQISDVFSRGERKAQEEKAKKDGSGENKSP